MGIVFFTELLKKLKLKKLSNSSSISVSSSSMNKKKGKSVKDNSQKNDNSITSQIENNKAVIISPTSSKEGKSFKIDEDGRRYHGYDESAYLLPNDDDEADRLHQQHWILRYVLQRNYHAPVVKMLDEGITVLDSGCGPATWTFEMGETYPNSKFYGIDISLVFPELIKPANVDFVIGNIAKKVPFPDNTFDYIHQRLLIVALTVDEWDTALKELYRVLKPGGYIELAEISIHDMINMGPNLEKLQNMTMDAFSAKGIPPSITSELKDRLIKAGFVSEVLTITPLPVNHEGKRGSLFWSDLRHVYLNLRLAMARMCPEWQDEEVYKAHIQAIGEESATHKTCMNWYDCYAQKPLA